MNKTYDIGYGRPPKKSQFKPGQSGNPRGRKPKRQKLIEETAAILSECVTGRDRTGRKRSLRMLEASYLALCKKALDGDRSALLNVMRTLLLVGPQVDSANDAWEEMIEKGRLSLCRKLGMSQEEVDQLNERRSTSQA